MINNYFPNLVGQGAVKRKLSFYLNAFHKTSQCPFLLMSGAKGLGKTEFAKSFAKNLYNQDGDRSTFLELNCSTIKNIEQFSSKNLSLKFQNPDTITRADHPVSRFVPIQTNLTPKCFFGSETDKNSF